MLDLLLSSSIVASKPKILFTTHCSPLRNSGFASGKPHQSWGWRCPNMYCSSTCSVPGYYLTFMAFSLIVFNGPSNHFHSATHSLLVFLFTNLWASGLAPFTHWQRYTMRFFCTQSLSKPMS